MTFLRFVTLFANICCVKMKINATSFVIHYNFKINHTKNWHDPQKYISAKYHVLGRGGGAELQEQIPKKFLPQTV